MKKFAGLGIAVALISVAAPMVAAAHTCYARSPRATGWGTSPSRATAARIALNECAVRTPRGLVCVLTRCT